MLGLVLFGSRTWMCTMAAPALAASMADVAICAGVTGTAGLRPGVSAEPVTAHEMITLRCMVSPILVLTDCSLLRRILPYGINRVAALALACRNGSSISALNILEQASLRRQHHTANDLAGAQVVHHRVHLVERFSRNWHLRRPGAADELHQFGHFWNAADVRALDGQCAHRNWRQGHRHVAAKEADNDVSAALDQAVIADTRALRRADEIDHRPGAALGEIDDLLRSVGRAAIDHVRSAGVFCRLALFRIDIDGDGRMSAHLPMQIKAHQAEAAGADDHRRLACERRYLFQGAECRHARAGKRRHALGRQIADVEQITRMRHQYVIGIAAVGKYAEAFHGAAEILLAAPAGSAIAAAVPRIGEHARADAHALSIRSNRHDLADILMAERHRQLHATVGETEPLAAAEIEPAIGEMKIAMADASRERFEQHLVAGRLWRRLLAGSQRLAADAELKHAHGSPFRCHETDGSPEILLRRKHVPIAHFRQVRQLTQAFVTQGLVTQAFACERQRSEVRPVLRMRRGEAESALKRGRPSQHDRANARLQRRDRWIITDRRIFTETAPRHSGSAAAGPKRRGVADGPDIHNGRCAVAVLQIARLREVSWRVMLAGEQTEPRRRWMADKGEREANRDLLAISQPRRPREIKRFVGLQPRSAPRFTVGARIWRVQYQHREAFVSGKIIAIERGEGKMPGAMLGNILRRGDGKQLPLS